MEDDQSCNDRGRADFAKQAEFDEDFKFEDAKRKLRIVLCMADRSNFPRYLILSFCYHSTFPACSVLGVTIVLQRHEKVWR